MIKRDVRKRDKVEQAMRKRRSAGLNMETPYRARSTDDIVRLHVGFRPDQIVSMNEAATAAGLTRSAWLRELVDDTLA